MSKQILSNEVYNKLTAEGYSFSKEFINAVIESVLEEIVNTLKDGKEVLIGNFGKFVPDVIKKKVVTNFKTGERKVIKNKKVVKFRVSPNFFK